MGLSLIEMSIGRYPIPPPDPSDIGKIFGQDTLALHVEAAKTGTPLPGKKGKNQSCVVNHSFREENITVFYY